MSVEPEGNATGGNRFLTDVRRVGRDGVIVGPTSAKQKR
jgi:hypothetical protein